MKRLKMGPSDAEAAKRTRDRDARFPPRLRCRRRRESGRGAFGLVDFVRHI